MRDNWYLKLPVEWFRLSISERGFLSTLYSAGEELTAEVHDVDTILGRDWRTVASGLKANRVIDWDPFEFGIVHLKIRYRHGKRRTCGKRHANKRHNLRTSTEIGVDERTSTTIDTHL